MHSKLLDQKTLGSIIAAAPDLEVRPRELAVEILNVLVDEMGEDQQPFWQIGVKTLAGMLPGEHSPHVVGRVLADMGLSKRRVTEGYQVFWNRNQVDLLCAALKADEAETYHVIAEVGHDN